MSRRNRLRRSNLQVGEIIQAESRLGFFPPGIYRVRHAGETLICLSVGDIVIEVAGDDLKITHRGLSAPISWLPHEIEFLRENPMSCGCPKCAELRASKERLWAKQEAAAPTLQ